MIKAGVIGHPVSHSRSPLIHRHWLEKYRLDGDYQAYDAAPESLRDEVARLRDCGLAGFNVTLPHKQAMLDICTTLNRDAEKIGAVNTVVFFPHGVIEGRNTDAFGFIENAKAAQGDFFKSRPRSATVIGAGGAARAVLYALKNEGFTDLRVTNRTLEHAENLAEDFGAAVFDWAHRARSLNASELLVNTTSLGMTGQPELDLPLDYFSPDGLVYDIVYAPVLTPLLQQAAARGCRTVTGIGMLLQQARPAFQAWFGVLPDSDAVLERKVLS